MTHEEILSQFDILRTEYIKALNDIDVLTNWGKPQLEALYNTKIGVHKLALLQLQLQVQSLKRKLELVRSAIATNSPLDIIGIELIVAAELARAEQEIMNQANSIENSKLLLRNLDSPTRSVELRKVYKQLAKQLHPDVNENLSAEQIQLWHLVKEAYENGDVEKLKALQVAYEKELTQSTNNLLQLSDEEMLLKIETLKEGLKLLYADIEKINSEFPFTIQVQLKDDEWVNQQLKIITEETNALQAYEIELTLEYNIILENYGE